MVETKFLEKSIENQTSPQQITDKTKAEYKSTLPSQNMAPTISDYAENHNLNAKQFMQLNSQVKKLQNQFGQSSNDLIKLVLESDIDPQTLVQQDNFWDYMIDQGIFEKLANNVGTGKDGKIKDIIKIQNDKYINNKEVENKKNNIENKENNIENKENNIENKENNIENKENNIENKKEISETINKKTQKESQIRDLTIKSYKKAQQLITSHPDHFKDIELQKKQKISELSKDPKLIAKAAQNNISIEQIATIACVGETLTQNPQLNQDSMAQQFLDDYRHLDAMLGLMPHTASRISTNTNIQHENPQVNKFIKNIDKPIALGEQAEVEKLLTKFINTENKTPDQIKTEIDSIQNMLTLNINIIKNKKAFSGYADYVSSLLDINIDGLSLSNIIKYDPKTIDPSQGFQTDFSLNGIKGNLKLDKEGNFFLTDYLSKSTQNGSGEFKITSKPINQTFKTQNIDSFLGNIDGLDIKEIIAQSGDIAQLQRNLQNRLEELNQKRISQTQDINTSCEMQYGFIKFQTSNQLLHYFKPPQDAQNYQNGLSSITQDRNPKLYNYFDILRNTLNHNTSNENLKLVNLFDQLKSYIKSNSGKLQSHPAALELKQFDSENFIDFIQKFTENNSFGNKIDIEKLEKFVQGVHKDQKDI